MHLGDIKGKSTAESIVLQFKKEEKRELYKSLLINQQRYHDGGCLEKHMLGRTNHTATLNCGKCVIQFIFGGNTRYNQYDEVNHSLNFCINLTNVGTSRGPNVKNVIDKMSSPNNDRECLRSSESWSKEMLMPLLS
ncbi:hypothetical protein QE152_g30809 [Popillia japonica]|uniref:Uncharacterized protein n=1 Tax=Popillia japonica TaxID=7064 RepID=A0AAW1JCM6_POPJA